MSARVRTALAVAALLALAIPSAPLAGQTEAPHHAKIVPKQDPDAAALSDSRQACVVGWEQCAETCNMGAGASGDCRKTCDASYFSCAGAEDDRRAAGWQ